MTDDVAATLPESAPTHTAFVAQYPHDGYDGHFVATRNPTAIADWLAFLTSLVSSGTPTVP